MSTVAPGATAAVSLTGAWGSSQPFGPLITR
jgi:hypothetical protein